MTESAIVWTNETESAEAGRNLGAQVRRALGGQVSDALLLFASPRYDHQLLLETLNDTCQPRTLIGCTSAGEFTSTIQGEGLACALALRSSDLRFAASLGRRLSEDREGAARELFAGFQGAQHPTTAYRTAIIFSDVLAGYTDDLLEHLTRLTAGAYQFVGGGAGDDARFQQTSVFCGREVCSDAVVALEILSEKPVGIGASHGWSPATEAMRVTESVGTRLSSLDAAPAVEIFDEHAARTGQRFEHQDPIPFFLHNTLGIDVAGEQKLRVPLATHLDGSVSCASDIPPGATVRIMATTDSSATEASVRATTQALQQLGEHRPAVALFFDCVATRLRLGRGFEDELGAVQRALGDVQFAGCNTYGQIVRAPGQFSGFHNCTAVVCVFPS